MITPFFVGIILLCHYEELFGRRSKLMNQIVFANEVKQSLDVIAKLHEMATLLRHSLRHLRTYLSLREAFFSDEVIL